MDFIEQTANSVGRERPHWNISPEKISRFLSELTDLSHRHGVAIGDEPHAFLISERIEKAPTRSMTKAAYASAKAASECADRALS